MNLQRSRSVRALSWPAALSFVLIPVALAGSLEPPGPPAAPSPTMKALDVIEPRIPVEWLPGSADALHVISQPGSYYLTGNLQGEAGKSGIFIDADDVVLDLGGFDVAGGIGTLYGVYTRFDAANVVVHNGTVGNWERDGVAVMCSNGLVYDVVSAGNGWNGIVLWVGNVIRSAGLSNGDSGIRVDGPGTIERCTGQGNGNAGIKVVGGVLVRACQAQWNGTGFLNDWAMRLVDSVAAENAFGVSTYIDAFVSRCNLSRNDTGLEIRGGGQRNRIDGNHFTGNAIGLSIDDTASRNLIIRNTARDNLYGSYVIPPPNTWGPIVNVDGAGDISSVAGADHPWANFEF